MIAIVNIGKCQPPGKQVRQDGWYRYQVRINASVIAEFKHRRADGLSVCLTRAAAAVDARDDELLLQLFKAETQAEHTQ